MIELTTFVDLGKVILEAAKQYKKARGTKHTLTADPLIELHDAFYKLKIATEAYRDELRSPSISAALETISRRWTDEFYRALGALDRIDVATIRVYSPSLADWIDQKVFVHEAEIIQSPPAGIHNEGQILKLRREIDHVMERWYGEAFVPLVLGESLDGLSALAKVLDDCTKQLATFIRDHWQLQKG